MKNKLRMFMALALVLCLALSLAACSGSEGNGDSASAEEDEKYDIVLLFDTLTGGINDGSFGEMAWEGIKEYCDETGSTCTYFTPAEESTEAYINNIEQAVAVGAKYIICPGNMFAEAIYKVQDTYPDVYFMILDDMPHNADYTEYHTADNTYSVTFKEYEAGFLAGYAVVCDGYRKLGFFGGMAVDAVAKFGYGYIQGAEYAAKELGLEKGDVEIIYWYSGDFNPTPEKKTTLTGWYESGTEVIFSCGGNICDNAFSAAEELNKAVIGVDIDQSGESTTCITSAMKNLKYAVYSTLKADTFPGGTDAVFGTESGSVGLPTDEASWRFQSFTIDQYNEIYGKLQNDTNGIASGILTNADISSPDEIPLELVNLNYVE